MSLRRYLQAAQRSIRRHGGGLRGLASVLKRALAVLSALGVRGLVQRLRSASTPRRHVPLPAHAVPLPAPVPVADITLKVGVMAHVFYADLIDEFAEALAAMPVPYTLLVSVVDEHTAQLARDRFAALPNLQALRILQVPNRGRDIAPLLVGFADEVRALDVVAHIHTKKSLYTGSGQDPWRRYLLDSLFGDSDRLAWLLGTLQAAPTLGMIHPETYEALPAWSHTWLGNAAAADALAARMGLVLEQGRYFDYPAGSMFWARVDAIRPLFDLELTLDDFPEERGQTDATVQHAIERLLGPVVQHRGYRLGVLAADGSREMAAEGERNVAAALHAPLAAQLQMAALQAELVTVDVFDTLVTRPFLSPQGARSFLAHRVAATYPQLDFIALRDDAESAARQRAQRDPALPEIYQELARQAGLDETVAAELMALELNVERALLRPRQTVLDALPLLHGRRVAALSDMYLPAPQLRQVLPPSVWSQCDTWWISCETGLRKDNPESWAQWSARHGVATAQWLHVGDNELSDIQLPQRAGLINPVHVLRPAAVLDLVPGLRGLAAPHGSQASWPEQLWRGLLANRFAAIADSAPQRLLPRPLLDAADAGYLVLGPLLLDFLLATVNVALARQHPSLLMLAREGYLLEKAWRVLAQVHPGMQAVQAHYFLASRRSTALPALAADGDLTRVLSSPFNGTLGALLQARLGEQVCAIVAGTDGSLLERNVFLPEMAEEVVQWLQPARPAIMALASAARHDWQQVWTEVTGDQPAMVIDLGYAGTIQCNLARISERQVGGMYLALRAGAQQVAPFGWAEARYFDGRNQAGEDSPILQHDLLLEALLTAPDGQFNGYARDAAGKLQPVFNPHTLDTAGLAVLDEVHGGALTFLEDVCAAVGGDVAAIELDPKAVLLPLQLLAEGPWQAGSWLDALATEDDFSGRGRVQARPA
ncbi:rhamnan synthesis F family protein [Stenotrophomonas sp. C3(2023)]|uniref:rhamnan synthesis F family protein n=1 Tax=Stenotrophomonas sp. C3(2023) TaxID=3080277 RepID=UPI00293CDFE9|nr:rhamnan synthesis F family protein [Stenotrophomonas sp. C3(2023)]MDV3469668.1 rhamnan synthesis F family protein [Stenotrophomonas sp. C3(2023)]